MAFWPEKEEGKRESLKAEEPGSPEAPKDPEERKTSGDPEALEAPKDPEPPEKTEAPEDMEDMDNPEAADPELLQSFRKRCVREGFLYGVLAALCLVFCIFSGAALAERLQKSSGESAQGAAVLTDDSTLSKLKEVQKIIEDSFLDEVDSEELAAYLFKGVAAGLDDAYANYYTAEELSSMLDSTRGSYYGIGATIQEDTGSGSFVIVQVYEGGPAQEAGLAADDIVRKVNGESVEELDLNGLVSLIKSETEAFTLTVYRPSAEQELDLTLTCSNVTPDYVTYEMLENQIGYIQLTEFTESAVEQFQNAVSALNGAGMEKLIVDVRDNPGGLLTSVCDILDEILPEGLMVYTEDKNGNREEYKADGERSVTCEVAVLVNGGSASASEIFAGAIQDLGIGPVIGTQTYGKGVVQKTYQLSDGSAFKLTVEKYFTPNGQDINGSGITPDIVVEDASDAEQEEGSQTESDPVLARAVAELSGNAAEETEEETEEQAG